MTAGCCNHCETTPVMEPGWRRVLWVAFGVNAGFFLIEIAAGLAAGSVALQADALDFLGDAANFAISLGVVGLALAWRSRAAMAKGATMIALAHCLTKNAPEG